jgi:hypothetical protein
MHSNAGATRWHLCRASKSSLFSAVLSSKEHLDNQFVVTSTSQAAIINKWLIYSFSLLHIIQTGSGAHPASYSVGTGVSFPGGKVAG